MPWVSKETHIEPDEMEEIQRSLRICVSTLDLMDGLQRRSGRRAGTARAGENRQIVMMLLGMARALKLGKVQWLQRSMAFRAERKQADGPCLDGAALLASQFADEVRILRQLLAATASRWNI